MEKRYECKSCGSILNMNLKDDPKKFNCCKEPKLILLSAEYDERTFIKFQESFHLVKSVLDRYMDMPKEYQTVVSLWILGTYLHKSFNSFPFLFFNAMRGSGKTRLLKLISSMCWNGSLINNMSESVLFRTAEEGTILLDEFEEFASKEKNVLRELLNSAYKKGSVVKRMKKSFSKDGEKHVVETFNLFTPVAMANIWGMEEVLGDRCITLTLEKSDNPTKTKLIEDFERNPAILALKEGLNEVSVPLCNVTTSRKQLEGWNNYINSVYNYTTTYNTYITYTYTKLHTQDEVVMEEQDYKFYELIDKTGINGRNLELFFPLFMVARLVGKKELKEILDIAKVRVHEKKEEEFAESRDVTFIDFVSKQEDTLKFIPVSEITKQFRDFAQYMDDDLTWMNASWVGRALKRLKLVRSRRRVTRGSEVNLNVPKAKERIKMFKTEDENETNN